MSIPLSLLGVGSTSPSGPSVCSTHDVSQSIYQCIARVSLQTTRIPSPHSSGTRRRLPIPRCLSLGVVLAVTIQVVHAAAAGADAVPPVPGIHGCSFSIECSDADTNSSRGCTFYAYRSVLDALTSLESVFVLGLHRGQNKALSWVSRALDESHRPNPKKVEKKQAGENDGNTLTTSLSISSSGLPADRLSSGSVPTSGTNPPTAFSTSTVPDSGTSIGKGDSSSTSTSFLGPSEVSFSTSPSSSVPSISLSTGNSQDSTLRKDTSSSPQSIQSTDNTRVSVFETSSISGDFPSTTLEVPPSSTSTFDTHSSISESPTLSSESPSSTFSTSSTSTLSTSSSFSTSTSTFSTTSFSASTPSTLSASTPSAARSIFPSSAPSTFATPSTSSTSFQTTPTTSTTESTTQNTAITTPFSSFSSTLINPSPLTTSSARTTSLITISHFAPVSLSTSSALMSLPDPSFSSTIFTTDMSTLTTSTSITSTPTTLTTTSSLSETTNMETSTLSSTDPTSSPSPTLTVTSQSSSLTFGSLNTTSTSVLSSTLFTSSPLSSSLGPISTHSSENSASVVIVPIQMTVTITDMIPESITNTPMTTKVTRTLLGGRTTVITTMVQSGVLSTNAAGDNGFSHNTGAIIGVAVAGTAIVIAAVVLVFWLCASYRHQRRWSDDTPWWLGADGDSRANILGRSGGDWTSVASSVRSWRPPLGEDDDDDNVWQGLPYVSPTTTHGAPAFIPGLMGYDAPTSEGHGASSGEGITVGPPTSTESHSHMHDNLFVAGGQSRESGTSDPTSGLRMEWVAPPVGYERITGVPVTFIGGHEEGERRFITKKMREPELSPGMWLAGKNVGDSNSPSSPSSSSAAVVERAGLGVRVKSILGKVKNVPNLSGTGTIKTKGQYMTERPMYEYGVIGRPGPVSVVVAPQPAVLSPPSRLVSTPPPIFPLVVSPPLPSLVHPEPSPPPAVHGNPGFFVPPVVATQEARREEPPRSHPRRALRRLSTTNGSNPDLSPRMPLYRARHSLGGSSAIVDDSDGDVHTYLEDHVVDGLLDPHMGRRWKGDEGESFGGEEGSLRDYVDYSRRIGGLVNNRMRSTTTFETVDTGVDTERADEGH
ncbi:hypothetical protein AMATHDRAFT_49892 [Amanita thiersii Skay4041]|uniref:Uncharacterized protein n=1 Tax=Amanita thiersii Skay4041 TaxID=703135 RepID=A0A2A9ND43_9AGAR|nr:hypothetical protein AMATHDRAFT_49892 [Amanita thiersii Skay4041]